MVAAPQVSGAPLVNKSENGQLRTVYCPLEIVETFIRQADANTKKFVETCAILAGNE
jgi:hypothetical protein